MSGLVPEKRLDKNGRMVTRHVRSGPGTSARSRGLAPRPALGQPAPARHPLGINPATLHASQLKRRPMAFFWGNTGLTPSWGLMQDGGSLDFSFTASDAEAFDVAAACAEVGDAVKLLSLGVRTAQEARDHLEGRGLGYLLGDQSEIMGALLTNGVRFNEVIAHWRMLDEGHSLQNRVNAFRYAASVLSSVPATLWVLDDVLLGEIDFEDLKAVGLGRLKEHQKIRYFGHLLKKSSMTRDGHSVESVRALAIRIDGEERPTELIHDVTQFAALVGPEATLGLPTLTAAANAHRALMAEGKFYGPEAAERGMYYARFMAGAGAEAPSAEFYEAGIPVETAIAVHASGGNAEQAAAVERGEVPTRLSAGHL